MAADEPTNSMCAIYAQLIEDQLRSADPDMDTVFELLGFIKHYCQTVGFEPGETPAHLEEHLIEEGSTAEGTVVVDGQEMPASAADLLDRD